MGKLTISMAIFNSYFDITRGYCFGGSQNWMTGEGADADASLRGGYQCAPCALGPRPEN